MESTCCIQNSNLRGLEDEKRTHLIPITNDTWTKITNCAGARQQLKHFSTSIWKGTIENLPSDISGKDLKYHLPCYRAFTSVSLPKQSTKRAPKLPRKTRKSCPTNMKSNERGVLKKSVWCVRRSVGK